MTKHAEDEGKRAQKPSAKATLKAWLKELAIVFGAFLILNSFVLASFEVPTGSMENEIMAGDFLLVNKFVFGGTTPKTVPFTSVKIPAFKLPAPWDVERGDVIVFIFPGMREETEPRDFAYYLKRCIAIAGDTIEVRDRIVYVNRKPAPIPRNMKFNSALIKPQGFSDSRMFPPDARFNEDNYGPVAVPKKDDIVHLEASNFQQWEVFIKREGHSAELLNGRIYIDGTEQTQYRVERDYVFGMGDNRDNSLDSRFWGFIPTESVVGTPLIVYWSWDPDIPVFNIVKKLGSIRWNRLGTLVR